MITHSFDIETPAAMGPGSFYGEQKHLCDICIITFSKRIYDEVLRTFPCTEVARIGAANGSIPIHIFEHDGKKIAFYLSGIGATLAATDIIDANWLTGATKFIMFGSAGSLNGAETQGRYVIPTEAYRDEGMSYHYAPPADYIRIPNSEKLRSVFAELGLPHVCGRVWTTDAFYRETRGQIAARQSEGCIAVEMELAGVQAACSFHGFELYDFLVTGDVLDESVYRIAGLSEANHNMDKFFIALELAARI